MSSVANDKRPSWQDLRLFRLGVTFVHPVVIRADSDSVGLYCMKGCVSIYPKSKSILLNKGQNRDSKVANRWDGLKKNCFDSLGKEHSLALIACCWLDQKRNFHTQF